MYNYTNLTEKELLKLVITERDGENITEELLCKYKTLPEVLIGATAGDLSSIKGLEKARISSPRDIADLLMFDMRYLKQEVFKGTLNSSIVNPREVFSSALKRHCANIIVPHNHPSGDTSPSKEDINITVRLKKAGEILGIKLLDHLIIGDGIYTSLKESGVI